MRVSLVFVSIAYGSTKVKGIWTKARKSSTVQEYSYYALSTITHICYNLHMDNKRKATLFAVLAVVCAAGTAPIAANQSISQGFLVLPLVLMGILLFIAGYYSGLASKQK